MIILYQAPINCPSKAVAIELWMPKIVFISRGTLCDSLRLLRYNPLSVKRDYRGFLEASVEFSDMFMTKLRTKYDFFYHGRLEKHVLKFPKIVGTAFVPQHTQNVESMLIYRWSNVVNGGPFIINLLHVHRYPV